MTVSTGSTGTHGGRVSLVGAGPGDPGLLTLRALECLESADIVLFDRLVGAGVLERIAPDCERISVGKTPHKPSTSQAQINRLLIDHARSGKHVVRLKGGDPYVFGRGAEERLALEDAGVAVEVVPGISSALAGPASAGIPLTLRNVATSFAVVTGHRSSSNVPDPDWNALARIDTLIILMGISRAPEIAQKLIDAGRSPAIAVAIVENASMPNQRVTRTTLESLAETIDSNDVRPPAIIVVGETARDDLSSVLDNPVLEAASQQSRSEPAERGASIAARERTAPARAAGDRDFDFLTVDLVGLLQSTWRTLSRPFSKKLSANTLGDSKA